MTRETAKAEHLQRVMQEREAALLGADSYQSAAAAAALDKPLADVRVHVVEAIRPHSWKTDAAADQNFLYCMFSIHHQDKPGTHARTPMCEARPNLAFSPISVQVYHFPAEIKVELLAWAGANTQPIKVGTTSVFVTAGPFDVDTTAEKTLRIDDSVDDWFPLVSASDWDSGLSPNGAIHILLTSEFHDAADPRLQRARGNAGDPDGQGDRADWRKTAEVRVKGDGPVEAKASRVRVFSTSTRVSAWDGLVGEEASAQGHDRDARESSVSTYVESDPELDEESAPEAGRQVKSGVSREPLVQEALSNGQQAMALSSLSTPFESRRLGSIGVSLCLSSSHASAKADRDQDRGAESDKRKAQELAELARGKLSRPVLVESVLEGSPAHAAGIVKVHAHASCLFASPPLLLPGAGIASLPCSPFLLVPATVPSSCPQAFDDLALDLLQGDRLVSVDDAAVDGLSVFAVESMIFGLVGTRLSLTLSRGYDASRGAGSSAQRVFKVQLVRDTDRAMAMHDKLNIHRAMQQSAAQAWAHSKFSVIHEDERLAGLSLPELMAAFRKGRVTRQSLLVAPNSGIDTFTQVSQLPDILLLLESSNDLGSA